MLVLPSKKLCWSKLFYSRFSMPNKNFLHIYYLCTAKIKAYTRRNHIFSYSDHTLLQSNQQKDLTEPSSLIVFPSPLPTLDGFVASRKLPFDNVTIPRRADDHRVDRMPITISYRFIMIVESCNLSSTHL